MIDRDDQIESLLDAVIDGQCDEDQLRKFESLIHDPAIRTAYLKQMRMHALLQWRHGRLGPRPERNEPRNGRHWGLCGLRRGSIAVLLLIGIGATVVVARVMRHDARSGGVAALVEARNVVWGEGQPPIGINARVGPGDIRLASGTLTLAFDPGAMVELEGPADLRVLSGTRIRAVRGRIIARAAGKAKGFAIETPSTLVVDQGTEFGVEIDASGRTGVVVFEGLVDVSFRRSADDSSTVIKQLGQGEGLSIGRSGNLCRIVSVQRRPGEEVWSAGTSADSEAVIRSVHDNIRDLGSSKYYRIVHRGFDEDSPAYVDCNHEWNGLRPDGIPAFLRGADYIMPFNDDKFLKDLQVTVELARQATLYVFFDNREETPRWLSDRFTDTGIDIGLDEVSKPGGPLRLGRGPEASIDNTFSIWKRDVVRGESIVLGALRREDESKAMYGIAAQPR
jgi:hypothetical protein